MSTTYLPNEQSNSALFMNRKLGSTALNNTPILKKATSTREGIDEGLLMIGVFCFLVPAMFLGAAMGLRYLEMSDLIANGLYIAVAALLARLVTAYIIKSMAAEKNRSEAYWMTLAIIAPSVSLILMSFFGTISKANETLQANTPNTDTARIKNYLGALEIELSRHSKAM